MQLQVFPFLDQYKFGPSFKQYLELRKQVFVDDLGWRLSHDGQAEMDQYDHPLAVYSLVSLNGEVIGGARGLPCSARWSDWSYMLADAGRGRLSSIPDDLTPELPDERETWEGTRIVLKQDGLTGKQRRLLLKLIIYGLCQPAAKQGAKQLIALSPVAFGSFLNSLGYEARAIGRPYLGSEDGKSYRALEMRCDPWVNHDECSAYLAEYRGDALDIPGADNRPLAEIAS